MVHRCVPKIPLPHAVRFVRLQTARSACYEFQLAVVENRADSHKAGADLARVKTDLPTKTKLFRRTEAEKQTARSACYEYPLAGIQNRQNAYRASIALAQGKQDLQKMTQMVARFNVQTQASAPQRLRMLCLNAALVKEEGKTEKAERDLATCRAKYERATLTLRYGILLHNVEGIRKHDRHRLPGPDRRQP
ncbi:unnamed protein product [Ectocarpus sp. CCAP 1310/34]|nr:unnamed protein product [Ectocarpus sp. CCAP 1310/34]